MDAAGRALIDALILRELLSGRQPTTDLVQRRPTAYMVTWPEYLFLGKLIMNRSSAWSVRGKDLIPTLRAIDELTEGGIGLRGWLGAFLDLGRVQDIHGISVQVSHPHPEAAQGVLNAMVEFNLDPREATNLVFAESEGVQFLATQATVSDSMLVALGRSNVTYRLEE
jgi:hypothetical protein